MKSKYFLLLASTRGYLLDMSIKEAMEARIGDMYEREHAIEILREYKLPSSEAITNEEKLCSGVLEKTPLRCLMYVVDDLNIKSYENVLTKILDLWQKVVAKNNVV